MENLRELTILEYQKETGLSKDAILYRIKKGEIVAEKKKEGKKVKWIIKTTNKPTNKTLFNDEQPTNTQGETELKAKIELLESKLEAEKRVNRELENSKEEILKSKQEQAEHINTLKLTCNLLERENKRLLQLQAPQDTPTKPNENIIIKQTSKTQKTEEPQDKKPQDLKIELSKKLLDDGLNEKERKRVKARFNKRIGERGIIKEQGKIYISKNENYEDLLKV